MPSLSVRSLTASTTQFEIFAEIGNKSILTKGARPMGKSDRRQRLIKAIGSIAFVLMVLQLAACDFFTYSDTKADIEFGGTYLVPKSQPKKLTNQAIIFAGGWGKDGQSVEVQSDYGLSLQTPLFSLTAVKPDPTGMKWDPTLGKTTHEAYLEDFFKNRWSWKTITASSPLSTTKMLQTKCKLDFDVNDFTGAGTKDQWTNDHIFDTTVLIDRYLMYVLNDTGTFESKPYYSFKIVVNLGNYNYDSILVEFAGYDGDDIVVEGFD
jgi:hypothetical protein